MIHIKEIIKKQYNMAKGKIKCKRCKAEATIYLKEKRNYVYCPTCGLDELLKTYNIK
jgi:ribosomal protein S27E